MFRPWKCCRLLCLRVGQVPRRKLGVTLRRLGKADPPSVVGLRERKQTMRKCKRSKADLNSDLALCKGCCLCEMMVDVLEVAFTLCSLLPR